MRGQVGGSRREKFQRNGPGSGGTGIRALSRSGRCAAASRGRRFRAGRETAAKVATTEEIQTAQVMNEAETRAEHIDPALKAAGWGVVEGSRIRREYPISPGRIEGRGPRG